MLAVSELVRCNELLGDSCPAMVGDIGPPSPSPELLLLAIILPCPLTCVGVRSLDMFRTKEFRAFLRDCGGEGPALGGGRRCDSDVFGRFAGLGGTKPRGLESRLPFWYSPYKSPIASVT